MSFPFLDLKRPQYPASTEVLLSSLAWSVVPRKQETTNIGLIYERRSQARHAVRIEQTRPKGDELATFKSELVNAGMGMLSGELTDAAADAFLDSMCGVSPAKGIGITSSSIGIACALLQDPRGTLAVKGPPNFANLINTMYELGGGGNRTAAGAWFEAASFHAKRDTLFRIERAFVRSTLQPFIEPAIAAYWPPPSPQLVPSATPELAADWWRRDVLQSGIETPFSWFRTSWDRLCDPRWYELLSARRWSSWAVCVIRHALAFTFLWEANFFRELVRGLLDDGKSPETVARWALVPVQQLVPHPLGSVSEMDVMPGLKRLLTIGLACRHVVTGLTSRLDATPESLRDLVDCLRQDSRPSDRCVLSDALAGTGELGGLPNLIETVRYSLLGRQSADTSEVDNYGLLKVVSRNYSHVAPGPEWIVVMSAVSSAQAVETVRLGDVLQSMKALSFQPRIDFLLGELERAGLCASAPDGDEGIEINLGFGRR